MSQWCRMQLLTGQEKQQILKKYEDTGIPIEIRMYLAHWIELNIKTTVQVEEMTEEEIQTICADLLKEIEALALRSGSSSDWSDVKLINAYTQFHYMSPLELYSKWRDCLLQEKRILGEENNSTAARAPDPSSPHLTPGGHPVTSPSPSPSSPSSSSSSSDVGGHQQNVDPIREETNMAQLAFKNFSARIMKIAKDGQNLKQQYDFMDLLHNEIESKKVTRRNCQLKLKYIERRKQQGLSNEEPPMDLVLMELQLDLDVKEKLQDQKTYEAQAADFFNSILLELETIIPEFLRDYVHQLKWSESSPEELGCTLANVRTCYTNLLDTVSLLQTSLARIGQSLLDGQQMSDGTGQAFFNPMKLRVDGLEASMLREAIVVQTQPLRVMKAGKKFDASVLFLCDERRVPPAPVVRVSLLNENLAGKLSKEGVADDKVHRGCGNVVNKTGSKLASGTVPVISMEFKNMAVSNPRTRKKEDGAAVVRRVMARKLSLFFSTTVTTSNGVSFEVWCCSVPFVLYVHVMQKPEGWLSIFWDKFLHEKNRIPYTVPEKVCWSKMAAAFTKFFKLMTNTTWHLTESNLSYLGNRLFKGKSFNDESLVSYQDLVYKENGGKDPNSFWEWFYAAIELVSNHLAAYWQKGCVVGFIDKLGAETSLRGWSPGTFLLRFSDTKAGAVSVCYWPVGGGGGTNVNDIQHLTPFTDADLKKREIRLLIHDSPQFKYALHYNPSGHVRLVAKEEAFQQHQQLQLQQQEVDGGKSKSTAASGHYKQFGLIMVIDSVPPVEQSWNQQAFFQEQSPATDFEYLDIDFDMDMDFVMDGDSPYPPSLEEIVPLQLEDNYSN